MKTRLITMVAILAILAFLSALVIGLALSETVKFDISALDSWCQGEDVGTVRMVGAWEHARYDDIVLVEDEQGYLWETYCTDVAEDDFLLLWLNDNGTPNDVRDDFLVKIWKEAHG